MSHVVHSRGVRQEQDTYICPHVGNFRGEDGSKIHTYVHMLGILGEQDGSMILTYVTCGAF